jgi:hypothetical protein
MPSFLWELRLARRSEQFQNLKLWRFLPPLTEYGESSQGDVAALHGELSGRLHLRIGHYRVIFRKVGEGTYQVLRVWNHFLLEATHCYT